MKEGTLQGTPGNLSRSMIVISICGAIAFLYLRTFLFPAVPFVVTGDQILFFARAVRMVHGQVLYRDFFELVTPGTDLLYAAAFRLFGIHAWIMQAWAICTGLALFCIITLIARKIARGPLILLPAWLFLVFDFNSGLDLTHHWYSTLAAIATVAVLTDKVNLSRIFAAGVLCGIATLFTQTQGLTTVIAIIAYLLWRHRSETRESSILTQIAVLLLPFTVVLSCVLGYYIYKAGIRTIIFDLVTFAPKFMSTATVNQPRAYLDQIQSYYDQFLQAHRPANILALVPVVFIYVLVPYIYIVGLIQIWRQRKVMPATLQQSLVLIHLVGLALFLAVASGPRYFRLCTVAPPAILICTWFLGQQSTGWKITRNLLWCLAVVFAILLPLKRQVQWHATLDLPIGRTAFSDVSIYREYQSVAQRTHPSEFFFNEAGLCLYLSLDNPTASEFVTYDEFTRPEQITTAVDELQNHPPHLIVLLPEEMISSPIHDHTSRLRQFIHGNYNLVQTFSFDHASFKEQLWEHRLKASISDTALH
jgi:hypothetical protein